MYFHRNQNKFEMLGLFGKRHEIIRLETRRMRRNATTMRLTPWYNYGTIELFHATLINAHKFDLQLEGYSGKEPRDPYEIHNAHSYAIYENSNAISQVSRVQNDFKDNNVMICLVLGLMNKDFPFQRGNKTVKAHYVFDLLRFLYLWIPFDATTFHDLLDLDLLLSGIVKHGLPKALMWEAIGNEMMNITRLYLIGFPEQPSLTYQTLHSLLHVQHRIAKSWMKSNRIQRKFLHTILHLNDNVLKHSNIHKSDPAFSDIIECSLALPYEKGHKTNKLLSISLRSEFEYQKFLFQCNRPGMTTRSMISELTRKTIESLDDTLIKTIDKQTLLKFLRDMQNRHLCLSRHAA